ncbi:conserved hypothetical protein [Ricinus communis]|uniref:Uncharacterized protein n=1 Tax=Ricinus communis TaxID=3988 RepID=B9RU04_RICCO|nr:conserved hypothetical protein [Ricinus communis]
MAGASSLVLSVCTVDSSLSLLPLVGINPNSSSQLLISDDSDPLVCSSPPTAACCSSDITRHLLFDAGVLPLSIAVVSLLLDKNAGGGALHSRSPLLGGLRPNQGDLVPFGWFGLNRFSHT